MPLIWSEFTRKLHLVGWKVDFYSKFPTGDRSNPTIERGEPGSVIPVGVSRDLLPMEKGTKELLLLNCPLSSRDC